MIEKATETMIASAADALYGHEIDIARTSSGHAMVVCECGKILLDAKDDEGDMTDREFEEGWHYGKVHFAEIVLETAFNELEATLAEKDKEVK